MDTKPLLLRDQNFDFMENTLFSFSGFDVSLVAIVMCSLVIILAFFIFSKLSNFSFKNDDERVNKLQKKGFQFRLGITLFFLTILLCLRILNFDVQLFDVNNFSITINHIAEILSLFSLALLADWMISHMVIRDKFRNREEEKSDTSIANHANDTKATTLVRYIVFIYLGQFLLRRLDLDFILFQREIKGELFTIHITDLLAVWIILIAARVVVWFITQVTLYRMYKSKDMDEGSQYAINQLVKYVVYVLALLLALDRVVSDTSIIYGGAAALLVGIGLGLQQTFNDFFSGLVLLFERSVMVGDVLEIEGQVGRVIKIGLRASRIETRNSVSMLVPNSKLVNQAVVNWTHFDNIVRFSVDVSVAYGTDTELVKRLLLEVITNVPDILDKPVSFVRLNDFGDNGLNFTLYFFTSQIMVAENIKSDVRWEIEKLFRKHQIVIPFPQRDIRMIPPSA